jgi:hypothetical protein
MPRGVRSRTTGRNREVRIITDSIIPLWQRLKAKGDTRLRVIRVSTVDGQRIVGVEILRSRVGAVLRSLGLGDWPQILKPSFRGCCGKAKRSNCDLKLKQSIIQAEAVLEVVRHQPHKFKELRDLGLVNEQIKWKQRFFVPSDEAKGVPLLAKLLERYPALADEAAAESASLPFEGHEVKVIDLAAWIISPESEQTSAEKSLVWDSFPGEMPAMLDPIGKGGDGEPLGALFDRYFSSSRASHRKPKIACENQGSLFVMSEFTS